ncbi:hypothetical protein A4H97_09465 [Niastella yeongjuensis]|uniref:Uncharacterized protein n=1 Tax=Niastella yeongjuensis TaxID=354355 RepID=A0A1V9EEP3_9BACT|nr:hypothetical protein [Niastella yeongjuensis]OQP44586.1 hypothetical protein A4H97_09465 [Niastella yeongjuensis]SEO82315.1 hypothetical protein SAMN05660816_03650 [Niastella yeongjuensis]
MTKVSFKKLSVLGLVLMAASAVTAAVLPAKSKDAADDNSANNATLKSNSGELGSGGVNSCIPDVDDEVYSCHLSVGATFTNDNGTSVGANHTVGNTSQSNPNNSVDTTSAAV